MQEKKIPQNGKKIEHIWQYFGIIKTPQEPISLPLAVLNPPSTLISRIQQN